MTIILDDYNAPQAPAVGIIRYKDGTRWNLRYTRVDVPSEWSSLPPPTHHKSNVNQRRWEVR